MNHLTLEEALPYLQEAFILIYRSEPPPLGTNPASHPLRLGWYGLLAMMDEDGAGVAEIYDACMDNWAAFARNTDLEWPAAVPRRWADANREFRSTVERLRERILGRAADSYGIDYWNRPPTLVDGQVFYSINEERRQAWRDAFVANPPDRIEVAELRLCYERSSAKTGQLIRPEDPRIHRILFPEEVVVEHQSAAKED